MHTENKSITPGVGGGGGRGRGERREGGRGGRGRGGCVCVVVGGGERRREGEGGREGRGEEREGRVRRPVCWSVVVVNVGQPVVETGQELNPEHAQIRTLLDRQREQILADCRTEIRKHKFQTDYDRRSIQKLSEMIESQQKELHRAQAEELHRRDQQLLHEQLLKQNWDSREAREKSPKEMEELKKFQSSTFDTIARRRLVEDQDTILELTGSQEDGVPKACQYICGPGRD